MWRELVALILAINVGGITHVTCESFTGEYCPSETFRPQCMKHEVIMMESAVYGRRYRGRCLESEEPDFAENPRYMGCAANVIGQLDAKCSGRKQCEVRIPDAELQLTRPCPKGLDMFLEVRYSCVEVAEEDRSCTVYLSSSPLHISRPSTGSTSSSQSNVGLHSCGTRSQPWLLEAPSGQRINISLFDFTPSAAANSAAVTIINNQSQDALHASASSSISSRHRSCPHQRLLGYLIDKSAVTKNVSICGSGSTGDQRVRNVYMSESNVIELVLAPNNGISGTFNILLSIEAVGCSDLIPPEDAWLKRTDNEAVVGCYTSRQTWHLKCEERRWIGVVSNCTHREQFDTADFGDKKELLQHGRLDNHQALLIVAVAFVGLAICLIIVCCGIYCLRRYSIQDKQLTTKHGHVQSDYKQVVISDHAAAAAHGRPQREPNGTTTSDFRNHAASANRNTTAIGQYYILDPNAVPAENINNA